LLTGLLQYFGLCKLSAFSGGVLERRLKMSLSNTSNRSNGRGLQACVFFCVLGVLPLGLASAQDYEAVETRLVKAVKAGELTVDQAGDMMAALARGRFAERLKAIQERDSDRDTGHEKRRGDAAKPRTEGAVKTDRLTREQANTRFRVLKKETPQENRHEGEEARVAKYRAIEAEIVAAVRAGKMSREEAGQKLEAIKKDLFSDKRSRETRKGDHQDEDEKLDYATMGKNLKAAVKAGKMTKEEAEVKRVEIKKRIERDSKKTSKNQANNRIAVMRTLKDLALGCHLFAEDHDGMLPATMAELKPYVRESYDPDNYGLVASGALYKIKEPAKRVLIRSKVLLSGGQQAVAFADGHVEIVRVK
jgi:hypothetical protein